VSGPAPGNASVVSLLQGGALQHPAVVVPGTGGLRFSYADLAREVEGCARVLAGLGIGREDRVALVFPNSAEGLVTFLGAAWVGAAAPLNPAYREDEFRFYLQDTRAQALVVPPAGAAAAARAAAGDLMVIEAAFDVDGRLVLEPSRGGVEPASMPPPPDAEQVALVLHTSGTTSRPKLVPLRHRNLTASVGNIVATYALAPEDVSLCLMPLFHVHGLLASALSTLASGGTVVVPRRFNAFEFWSLIDDHAVTWYSAVPTIHQLVLGRGRDRGPGAAGGRSLRFVRSCSAALSPELTRKLEEHLGAPVLDAYGMTEAAHQMASNPLPPGERVLGSVGLPTGVDMAILDEAGNELPHGATGEVAVRGPNLMDGYESNPQANAEAFAGTWFRTGDQGVVDRRGYLTLVGRIKELINRGGEKIAPREIDEVLLQHPAVAEAVAFGVQHRTWGEEVAAAVVLKSGETPEDASEVGEKELIDFCRQRLADFKVPRHIHLVDEIPRTATGKVQRRNIAASFESR
jgi:acyl-CoA synthetase (AMP-forming)/AMP-acid ligase II